MASVLDQIRKLDEQKAKLLGDAKAEALIAAEAAIAALNELGFQYRLVEGGGSKPATTRTPGTRRTGIRDEVLDFVKNKAGIGRAEIIEMMNGKGVKSIEQSISNALSALKKAGTILAHDGGYKAP